jgi:regulator of sirC expression with transglutaminase-like and TPR domain
MPIAAYCRPAAYRAFAQSLPAIETPAGLFRAGWAIAQHELPDEGVAAGEAVVSNLAVAVKRRVRSGSAEALLAHLHDVMFDVAGFRGNREDYYNPANSYLPEVLRTRRGLPITLALVYRRVASEAGLVVHGVNAPGHFLAEVEIDESSQTPALGAAGEKRSIYVDPFYGGGMLHEAEVLERIAEATGRQVAPTADLVARATPRQWLARMLHNLQAAFAAAARERDVFAMQELEHLLHVA